MLYNIYTYTAIYSITIVKFTTQNCQNDIQLNYLRHITLLNRVVTQSERNLHRDDDIFFYFL